jgi:DNA-binding MarR family transcriptional regulator/N-acetylglutamate synthase-like GNAT family acetyltransferase
MSIVEEVRDFNRFYTRKIRLLDEHMPASEFALPDARVIYELAKAGEQTAADIGRRLDMDKAHLSRIVARLRARGIINSRINPSHAKHRLLSLTDAGHSAFAQLEAGTRSQLDALLAPVEGEARQRLVTAMQDIKDALGERKVQAGEVRLRGLQPGDIGWIAHRQMLLYHREYDWDWTYEGLVCEILGRFVACFDPAREDGWVAERDGSIAGSVFLMKSDDPAVAKLRLLYVEPSARGAGIGRKLVQTCIDRAKALGYLKLTLWTNDILVAARRLYLAAGFRLVDEYRHHSFGHDLTGQTWVLDL